MGQATNIPSENSSHSLDLVSKFHKDGFLIIEDAFDPETLRKMQTEAVAKADAEGAWRQKFANGQISVREISNIYGSNSTSQKLIESSFATEIIRRIIDQDLMLFRDAYIEKVPNEASIFPLHQDSEFWDIQPEDLVSMWIPFQDTDLENGVLQVVPGSHKFRFDHSVKIGETTRLPKLVNKILRKSAKNSNLEKASGLSERLKSQLIQFASQLVNSKLLPFLSRNFKAFEKFAELFVVENDKQLWEKAFVPKLKIGDCIIYHSKTVHGSLGNSTPKSRCSYIPTFMGVDYTRNGVPVSKPELAYSAVNIKKNAQ